MIKTSAISALLLSSGLALSACGSAPAAFKQGSFSYYSVKKCEKISEKLDADHELVSSTCQCIGEAVNETKMTRKAAYGERKGEFDDIVDSCASESGLYDEVMASMRPTSSGANFGAPSVADYGEPTGGGSGRGSSGDGGDSSFGEPIDYSDY